VGTEGEKDGGGGESRQEKESGYSERVEEGRDKLIKQNSRQWVLRGRAIKRVKVARVGEEPERRLRRARVAEEVGEGG
jgi:hypothetical protein